MNPVDETNSDVALKLDILTLRDVKTWLIPCMDDLSCALEIYPIEPRACSELKSVADEMKVDGTDERYPIEPKPTKELVSCGVEMMLDKDKEDKQPIDPKPTKELVSCGVEMILDKDNDDK